MLTRGGVRITTDESKFRLSMYLFIYLFIVMIQIQQTLIVHACGILSFKYDKLTDQTIDNSSLATLNTY